MPATSGLHDVFKAVTRCNPLSDTYHISLLGSFLSNTWHQNPKLIKIYIRDVQTYTFCKITITDVYWQLYTWETVQNAYAYKSSGIIQCFQSLPTGFKASGEFCAARKGYFTKYRALWVLKLESLYTTWLQGKSLQLIIKYLTIIQNSTSKRSRPNL